MTLLLTELPTSELSSVQCVLARKAVLNVVLTKLVLKGLVMSCFRPERAALASQELSNVRGHFFVVFVCAVLCVALIVVD